MPEGPSLVILKELISCYSGKTIIAARGNARIDMDRLPGRKIVAIRTWGKHLLISLKDVTIRIHFLMFGSYSIGEQTKPGKSLRLHLGFKKGNLFFYTCAVKLIEEDIDELYDWEADVMSDNWSAAKARKKLKKMPGTMVCDALLDQQVFSGVGNIIKNEVLYRIRLHPETLLGNVPSRKLTELINEARNYSFDFLKWKKEYTLRKHWLAHTKKTCKRCDLPFLKKYCGKTKRRTFFCTNCQKMYP
ncbi:MAG: endonuclease [Chitinophagaceae bacterium]|nr:endonuclease [Chitinophagaceae bacterium]